MKKLLFVKSQNMYLKGFFYRTLVETPTTATNYGLLVNVMKYLVGNQYPDVETKDILEFTTIKTKWEKPIVTGKQIGRAHV